MGTFSVEATVANLADPAMRVTLGLLVDTGATWTTLPGDVAGKRRPRRAGIDQKPERDAHGRIGKIGHRRFDAERPHAGILLGARAVSMSPVRYARSR